MFSKNSYIHQKLVFTKKVFWVRSSSNGPTFLKIVKNYPKFYKCPKWSKVVENGPKW